MPQVVLLPSAPNTGLGNLGSVLMDVGRDYAQNKRYDDRLARQRQNQLQDIDSARAYDSTQHVIRHEEGLQDEEMRRQKKVKDELVRLGFLSPDKLDAPNTDPAVIQAGQEFAKSEAAQRYKPALEAGFLTYDDLGDAARVAKALGNYSDFQQNRLKFGQDQRGAAVTVSNDLATEAAALRRKAAELDERLSADPPAPTPNEIRAAAVQAVRASGQPVSDKNVDAMMQSAAQELRQQALVSWGQQRQQFLIQRQLLTDQLRDVSGRLNTNTSQFGVVGVPSAAPATPSAPTVAAPSLGAAQARFQQGLTAPASAPAAPAAAPSPMGPYAGLRQQAAMDQQQKATAQNDRLREPYMDVMDQLQSVDDEISAVEAGLNPEAAQPPLTGMVGGSAARPSIYLTPDQKQQRITQLQQRKAALLQQKEAARRNMLGLPEALITPAPYISNPQSTTPVPTTSGNMEWWRSSPNE